MYKKIISIIIISFSGFLSLSKVTIIHAQGIIVPEFQQILSTSKKTDQVDIIVNFTNRVDFHTTKHKGKHNRSKLIRAVKIQSAKSQLEVIQFLEKNNIFNYKKLWLVNSLAITVSADMVSQIATFADVSEIHEDHVITLNATTTNVPGIPELNIEQVKAPVVWSRGFTGQGAVIGIIGSGVDGYHPDLAPRFRGGNNSWFDATDDPKTTIPFDVDKVAYHGTGVMGIALGGNQSGLNIGVAPGAKWIAAKIFSLDPNTNTLISRDQDRLAAFQWMLDPDGDPNTQDAPDVVNNSWNLTAVNTCDTAYQDSINALKAADISVVFSAGNSGPGLSSSLSPANNQNTISVGAVDDSLVIETYSSRGPTPTSPVGCSSVAPTDVYPNIVAPGSAVLTADGSLAGTSPNPYTFQTGTSFAAPHISGALAVLKSAFPNSTSVAREDALRIAANIIDLGKTGNDNSYGWGFLDLDGAYQILLNGAGLVTTAPYVKNHLNSIVPDSISTPILVLTDALVDARKDSTNKINLSSVIVISEPVSGIVSIDDMTGIVSYSPMKGFIGSDSFTYTVSDILGNTSNTGLVKLVVEEAVIVPVVTPPVSSGGGGGCTLQLNSKFDPVIPVLFLLVILYITWRKKVKL